jgi:hypothetical protein
MNDDHQRPSTLTCALVGIGGAAAVFGVMRLLAGQEKHFGALELPGGGGILLEKGDADRPEPTFSPLMLPRMPARITRARQRVDAAKTPEEAKLASAKFNELWEQWEGHRAWEGDELPSVRVKAASQTPASTRTKARRKLEAAKQRLRAAQQQASVSSTSPSPQAEVVEFHPELTRLQRAMSRQAREEANRQAQETAKKLGVSDWRSMLANKMNLEYAIATGDWSGAERYADALSRMTHTSRELILATFKKASADRVRKMVEDETGVSTSEEGDATFLRRTPFRVIHGSK